MAGNDFAISAANTQRQRPHQDSAIAPRRIGDIVNAC
jgi:hypothetical protein